MGILVLTLGIVNLAIGVGLALALQSAAVRARISIQPDKWFRRLGMGSLAATEVAADPEELPPTSSAACAPSAAAFPSLWDETYAPDGWTVTSFDEALLWLVTAELVGYRAQLLSCGEPCRTVGDSPLLLGKLQSANQLWQQKLATWVAEAAACSQRSAEAPDRLVLDELLLNHSFQIKAVTAALAPLERAPSDTAARPAVWREMLRAFEAANALRDRTQDILIQMLRAQNRLHALPPSIQYDAASSTLSRMGLESTWNEWFQKNSERTLLVSAVLLDVDRTSKLNECFQLRTVDDALAAFGAMLKTIVRQQRGFDRVVRFTGQSFLLFLGDTSGREAINAAERIRQTIEALSFRVGDQHLELTASCGVVELGGNEPLADFLIRARNMAAEAKKAGRNRTVLEENQQSHVVELPQYMVKGRVLEVAPQPEAVAVS